MDVREKLVELLDDFVSYEYNTEELVDELIAHGITVQCEIDANTFRLMRECERLKEEKESLANAVNVLEEINSDLCKQIKGVTVQECGCWVSYQSDEPYGCQDEKEWYRCSKCGKDAYGRCYEDEWYSAPILSAHCPNCGTKMLPQPPKGE